MKKRLISVLLAVLLCICSVPFTFAQDTAPEVEIVQNVYYIRATIKSQMAQGKVTGFITKDNNGIIYGVDETSDSVEEEGKFVYTLTFRMRTDADEGTYTLNLGIGYGHEGLGYDYSPEVDFTFVNPQKKVDFYNALNSAGENQIFGILTGEGSKATCDLSVYKKLVKTLAFVNKEIEDMPLSATIDTVDEVESRFNIAVEKLIVLASVAEGNKDFFDAGAKAAIEKELLDGKYYDKVEAATVAGYMKPETLESLSETDISSMFDEAVLLAAKDIDYLMLEEIFLYYVEKDTVSVDEIALGKLDDNQLHSVFGSLKEGREKYSTVLGMAEEFDRLVGEMLDNGDDNDVGGDSVNNGYQGGVQLIVPPSSATEREEQKETPSVAFTDLGGASWATEAILALTEKGVLSGRGDGKFYPNDTVTREEFVKMIVTVFDSLESGVICEFEDIANTRWSYSYIASAVRLGIVNGVDGQRFNPEGTVTREDMAVILYRAYTMMETGKKGSKAAFTDAAAIADYAKDAVSALSFLGVVNGMGDGTFAPKGKVTRAQAAKVLYEMIRILEVA